jgi:DcmR-like sensory protein
MMNNDNLQFNQPLKFVRNVARGKHIVLFYEEAEYARMLLFEFLNSGLIQKERCSYISEEETESVEREMYDAGIGTREFLNNGHLSVYQISNLADHPYIPPMELERLSQLALHSGTKKNGHQPDRLVLKCIFKINTQQQIRSNLDWERDYRDKDLKRLRGTMICTYPVNNILFTISDSIGDYGRWMSNILELYDGVIFARKLWKGVAFNLD